MVRHPVSGFVDARLPTRDLVGVGVDEEEVGIDKVVCGCTGNVAVTDGLDAKFPVVVGAADGCGASIGGGGGWVDACLLGCVGSN